MESIQVVHREKAFTVCGDTERNGQARHSFTVAFAANGEKSAQLSFTLHNWISASRPKHRQKDCEKRRFPVILARLLGKPQCKGKCEKAQGEVPLPSDGVVSVFQSYLTKPTSTKQRNARRRGVRCRVDLPTRLQRTLSEKPGVSIRTSAQTTRTLSTQSAKQILFAPRLNCIQLQQLNCFPTEAD